MISVKQWVHLQTTGWMIFISIVPFAMMLAGCSSSSSGPQPGTDGDWEAADLLDNDDGDSDMEPEVPVDTEENEPEVADGDADDAEPDGDGEEDAAEYPELPEQQELEPPELLDEEAYSTYSLLDRAEIRPCAPEVTIDSPEFYWAVSVHRATDGILYFGNRYGLWRLEESPSLALVCVPGIEETVWSITSRRVNDSDELWVGLDGRAGVLRGDTWEFVNVPETWKHEGADYNGPASSMVWKVAVNDQYEVIQTTQGVAYRQGSAGFQIIDWCPEGALVLPDSSLAGETVTLYNKAVTSSTWAGILLDGAMLRVGGHHALYAINLISEACTARCEINDGDGRYYIVAGMQGNNIKAVRCKPRLLRVYVPSIYYGSPYTGDLETGFCTPDGEWHAESTAQYTFAATTSDSRMMASAFPVYTSTVQGIELKKAARGIDPSEIAHILHLLLVYENNHAHVAVFSTMSTGLSFTGDYNMPGFVAVTRQSVEWSAALIIDQGGYWYSPGFTRIEMAE